MQESSRKISTFALLTTPKPLTVWITTNCGKFLKRWEYQAIWLAPLEICIQNWTWNNRLVPNWERSTSSLYIVTLLFNLYAEFSPIQFSHSVMSDSLRSHGLQHARPPCPSPTPGVYSNSCTLNQWCHPTILSSVVPFSSHLPIVPSIRVFTNESVLCIRWPKYWSFSFNISPSNECPGLISFRIDWLDLLVVQGTLTSPPTPQFKSINSSALSFLYSPTLTSIHDHWKNHSLDCCCCC